MPGFSPGPREAFGALACDFKEVTGPLRDLVGYMVVLHAFSDNHRPGPARRRGRQVEQLDAVPVLFHPFAGLFRCVSIHVVHDEKYLAVDVVDEEIQKLRRSAEFMVPSQVIQNIAPRMLMADAMPIDSCFPRFLTTGVWPTGDHVLPEW